MKGWGANLGCDLRERKKSLLSAILALDLRADSVGLSPDEWLSRYDLEDQLSVIYTDEEAYWRLRGAQKWVLKGDANTAYFQAIANGRHRDKHRHAIPAPHATSLGGITGDRDFDKLVLFHRIHSCLKNSFIVKRRGVSSTAACVTSSGISIISIVP